MNNTNTNTNTNTTRSRDAIIADILDYFKEDENAFIDSIEELSDYNGYLGDDRWEDMDELSGLYRGEDPIDILNRAFNGYDADTWHTDSHGNKEFGAFNPNRDYFRFNGYGNLVSSNYKDYSDYLNDSTIEEMEEYAEQIDEIQDNDELKSLFDELKEAEE